MNAINIFFLKIVYLFKQEVVNIKKEINEINQNMEDNDIGLENIVDGIVEGFYNSYFQNLEITYNHVIYHLTSDTYHLAFHEWQKSTNRISWKRMKITPPTIPTYIQSTKQSSASGSFVKKK